ncbi:MAG: tetratricopeptide repeat protein [Bacteroidales bacterium]|nr:tetratricopeptide repeat protein [Bacteroidales bacterium]
MNYQEVDRIHQKICRHIADGQIKYSIEKLGILVRESKNGDLINQLENYRETFANLLKYSFERVEKDPERDKVYSHLIRSILELADKAKEEIIAAQQILHFFNVKRKITNTAPLSENEIRDIIKILNFENEIDGLKKNQDNDNLRDETLEHIFNLFWLKDKYKESEIDLAQKIIIDINIPWSDKSLFVSAITLSLLRCFDISKFQALFDFNKTQENQVWQRALAGIIINLCHYDSRLVLYPELLSQISDLARQEDFKKNVEFILLQLLKSRETEKITKRFREEIIPEMMKLRPSLENKLDLDNILSDKLSEDKNPDWENFFKDSPGLLNKLEEMSRLQLEGSDVFMSTFSMLKQFDFFNTIKNWFLPFYKENNIVKSSMAGFEEHFNSEAFIEGLEKTAYLCNSDKYSFCLNVKIMPREQKNLMVEMFNMEINAMNEVSKDDELLNQHASDQFIFTQYFQDLYRFFKLYAHKNEFYDIFAGESQYHKTYFLNNLFDDQDILRNIAEFYFEKEYYLLAIEAFNMFLKKESKIELFQKIAYSFQMLGRYEDALEYYHKAELFDKNKSWNYRKIAQCYRKLKIYDKAIDYYKKAEKLEPENLYTQTFLGHTYLDMKEFETALKYYYKVEYLAPENKKIQLPIAWCSFMQKKLDSAIKYVNKVLEKDPGKHDCLIAAHIFWCNNDKTSAIDNYKKALKASGYNYQWFVKEIKDDQKYLHEYDITEQDVSLMIDYIEFFTNDK